MRKAIAFKGWDWTELLDIWPEHKKVKWPKDTKKNPFAEEDAQKKWLCERMVEGFDAMWWDSEPPSGLPWEYLQVRRFAKRVAKISHHSQRSILSTIANTESHHDFLCWFTMSLGHWWT